MEGVTDLPTQEAEGETRPKSPASESNELSASMLSSTLQSAVSTPPTVLSDSMATSSPHEKPTTPVKSIFADDADDEIELPPAQIAAAAAKPKISVADLLAPKVKHNRPARERRSLPVSYNVSQTINAQSGFMYKSARHIRDENAKIPNNELTWRQTISAATPKKRAAPSTPKVVEPTTTTADNTEVGDTSAGDKAETAAVEDTSAGSKKRKRASRAKKEQVPENVLADTPDISTKVVSSKEKEAKELVKKVPRELKRLQDTDGFADPKKANPAFISIWSKGKKIDPKKAAAEARAAARAAKSKSRSASASPKDTPEEKSAEPAAEDEEPKKAEKPKPQYIEQGRYVGQEDIMDLNLTPKERRAKARAARVEKQRKLLPLPMWTGQTTLTKGRDFKLPFGVFNPLPPGSAKPEPYGKMAKNRFIGDAQQHWRPHKVDHNSRCTCDEEDGCGEQCHNRLMLYECDEGNCAIGPVHCKNRAFADLLERTRSERAHKFNIGVEVFKTADRGFGVRANRSFEAGQIIVEYCGEIITQSESDRRMNNEYKNNECYYLMSFAQNMIIDATRGSIARFVNHSCEPNCKMDQWIVAGKTRMALFAEREILTGEELTYDYNFSNFSQSNVQTCLCESEKCRGIVGRRGKKPSLDERVAMAVKGAMAAGKSAVNAGKRKLKEVLGGAKDEAAPANAKKRKIATPKARTPAKVAEPTPVKSAARSKVFASAAVSTKGGKKTVVAKVTKTAVAAKVVSTPAPAKPGQLKIRFVQKPQVKNMQPQPAPPPVQQRLKLLCKPASPGGGKGANASPVKKSARKAKPTFRFINRTA